MSLTGSLFGLVRAALPVGRATPRCPTCDLALESPRPHPLTASPARRCPACGDWFPAAGKLPYMGD